ncbi:MAG: putative metal-dependent hydrolase, partial [bacterium]|nr:putative metal-dependent hydrolase [bacterium]
LSYPIGKFQWRKDAAAEREKWISEIAAAPAEVRNAVAGLTDEQLATPYRPGGWTLRQVVHHLADSHLNAYVRLRLALTEDNPAIKPYDQDGWAKLHDAANDPLEVSLVLLEALHHRWLSLVRSLDEAAYGRTFNHPELDANVDVSTLVAMYAWHGKHHVAHITRLREREGWV